MRADCRDVETLSRSRHLHNLPMTNRSKRPRVHPAQGSLSEWITRGGSDYRVHTATWTYRSLVVVYPGHYFRSRESLQTVETSAPIALFQFLALPECVFVCIEVRESVINNFPDAVLHRVRSRRSCHFGRHCGVLPNRTITRRYRVYHVFLLLFGRKSSVARVLIQLTRIHNTYHRNLYIFVQLFSAYVRECTFQAH